jgi:hypothetical protein
MSWEIVVKGNDFEVVRRKCRMCKKDKPLAEFSINRSMKDGLMTFCRQCNSERRARKPKVFHKKGLKTCRLCGETKTYSHFYIMKINPDGYNNRCRDCDRIQREKRIEIDYAKMYLPI